MTILASMLSNRPPTALVALSCCGVRPHCGQSWAARGRARRRRISARRMECGIVRRACHNCSMIGSRIAARFAQLGLDTDIPEWRGQASNGKPAILEIAERLANDFEDCRLPIRGL